jgi:hypothetical protein
MWGRAASVSGTEPRQQQGLIIDTFGPKHSNTFAQAGRVGLEGALAHSNAAGKGELLTLLLRGLNGGSQADVVYPEFSTYVRVAGIARETYSQ